MECGRCQLYDGTGFPAAEQFKVRFLPATSSSVSFSGLVKVGGSEDIHGIQTQTEREKQREVKVHLEEGRTHPILSEMVKLNGQFTQKSLTCSAINPSR